MNEIVDSVGLDASRLWCEDGENRSTPKNRLNAVLERLGALFRTHADTIIIPGGAILFYNLAFYTGLATFGLRQVQGNRFPLVAGLLALGVAAGELALPYLLRWEQHSSWKRAGLWLALLAWLLASPATIAPGLHNFIYNNPLRLVSSVALGMSFPPVYYLYFSRFPLRHRGLWYGISTALGVLLWRLLVQFASRMPYMDGGLHHPFQRNIYPVLSFTIMLLALFSIAGLCRRRLVRVSFDQPAVEPVAEIAQQPDTRRALVRTILTAAFLMYMANGLLQIKLFPMVPMRPGLAANALVGVMASICAPLAGWMLDENGKKGLVKILSCCSWIFILAPVLMVLSDTSWLHTLVQMLGVGGWFLCNIAFGVVLARLAPTPLQSGRGASIIYVFWLAAIVGLGMTERLFHFDAGSAIATGMVLMFLFHFLVDRIKILLEAEPDQDQEEERNTTVAESPLSAATERIEPELERFIDGKGLTRREIETLYLLLHRLSTREIAARMEISENTAKKHIYNTMRKFNSTDRHALVDEYEKSVRDAAEQDDDPAADDDSVA
ncbi:MAG: LuxR C-terminal-related transcriptional regulator [Planctomycetes bacterium]|nr:LuxR C-terminal-related transcriptional regulator [Planctomycetota bacterium]